MAVVKCSANTCIHNKDNVCTAKTITMEDFEYYADSEGKRRDYLEDDMKCLTYESKNKKE